MALFDSTIGSIVAQDAGFRKKAKERLKHLVMPRWALGRLMDLAVDLAGITGSMQPPVKRKCIAVFAADHGVANADVSKYPSEVTRQMVHLFVGGKAGINALSRVSGSEVVVVDMGVMGDFSELVREGKIISKRIAPGTRDMSCEAAMTREQAIRCVEAGIEVARKLNGSADVFGVGEMGIGNTTAASAIIAAASARPVAFVTGRGTGIDDGRLEHKIQVIERALEVNRPDPVDGLDILSKVGGFEIGAIAGFILAAAALRKPVVLDGFPSTAGAVIAHLLSPLSAQYMIAGHRSPECGHRTMCARLRKRPLLDLRMRLGEGTGAALAMTLIDAAARILTDVATFEEGGVSQSK